MPGKLLPPSSSQLSSPRPPPPPLPRARRCARAFTVSSHVILPKSPGKQRLTCLKMRNQPRPTERRQLPQGPQLDSKAGYHFLPKSLEESPEVGVVRAKQHFDDGSGCRR